MKKQHQCMRCLEVFDCPTPETCEAQYDVLPAMPRPGVLLDPHCPEQPTWEWVRARIERERARLLGQRGVARRPSRSEGPLNTL